MKKKYKLTLLILCVFFKNANSQIVDPIKWSFTTNKINNCEFELIIQAKIEEGWHLYGQKSYAGNGPIPTSFHFIKSLDYQLIGKTSEKNSVKKFEPVWGFELEYFEHQATFKQKIKMESDKPFEIKGDLEFMTCTDVTCLPPSTVEFSFKLDGSDCLNVKSNESAKKIKTCECDSAGIVKAYRLAHSKYKNDSSGLLKANVEIGKNNGNELTNKNNYRIIIILSFLGTLVLLLFLNYKRNKK